MDNALTLRNVVDYFLVAHDAVTEHVDFAETYYAKEKTIWSAVVVLVGIVVWVCAIFLLLAATVASKVWEIGLISVAAIISIAVAVVLVQNFA